MKHVSIPATEYRVQIDIEYEDALATLVDGADQPEKIIVQFCDTKELIVSLPKDSPEFVYTTGPSIELRDMLEGFTPTYHHLTILNPDSDDRRTLVSITFCGLQRSHSKPAADDRAQPKNVISFPGRTLH